MRTIRITGKGSLSFKPDTLEIQMKFTRICPIYEDAVRESIKINDYVRSSLMNLGIKKEDIQNRNFDVYPKYNYKKDEFKNEIKVFEGFQINLEIYVLIPMGSDIIPKVFNFISSSKYPIEMSLDYKLKNTAGVKEKLIELAILDAKKTAEVISKSSGVQLKEISSIDYSSIDINFKFEPINSDYLMRSASMGYEFEPEELDFNDEVTIVWEIE